MKRLKVFTSKTNEKYRSHDMIVHTNLKKDFAPTAVFESPVPNFVPTPEAKPPSPVNVFFKRAKPATSNKIDAPIETICPYFFKRPIYFILFFFCTKVKCTTSSSVITFSNLCFTKSIQIADDDGIY